MENIRDSSCGKMCPEHSRQTAARTSKLSSKASVPSKKIKLIFLDMRNGRMPEKSWQTITQSHGEFSMLNTGESPTKNASTLSQILEAGVPEKYYLSQRACLGILKGQLPVAKSCQRYSKQHWATGATCLNDHGGNRIDITENVTATLRAEAHHPPCVMESAGFCTEHSAKARSIGFEKKCPRHFEPALFRRLSMKTTDRIQDLRGRLIPHRQ